MDGLLTREEAEAHVKGVCFKTGPPRRTGVELEWLVHDRADARLPVAVARLAQALGPSGEGEPLPRGGRITREPGGQVELSTAPADSLAGCLEAGHSDLTLLRERLARAGLALGGYGLDPHRDPPRVVDHPRYRAMEAHFDRTGPWGRVMMRGTAAVQVCLDAGDDSDGPSGYRYRWRLAHRLGPVLVAAFANSPLWQGRPTGWVSTRQAVWSRIDPCRTRPPDGGADPRSAWAQYALDAELLCVRRELSADWSAPRGLTFRSWLAGGSVGRPPALEDLDYHLSTLFPPVRPRGWLELRMIDAQPGDGWQVAAAVAATLLDDPVAADAGYAATEPLCPDGTVPPPEVWSRAARLGPADPEMGKAVRACFTAAETALAASGRLAHVARAVGEFAQRYPERGRCPADDQLNEPGRGPVPAPPEGHS